MISFKTYRPLGLSFYHGNSGLDWASSFLSKIWSRFRCFWISHSKCFTFISDLGPVYCLHWNSVFQKFSTVFLYILFLISVPKSMYVALLYIWSTFFALFNDALFLPYLFIFIRKVKLKICRRIIAVINPFPQSYFFTLLRLIIKCHHISLLKYVSKFTILQCPCKEYFRRSYFRLWILAGDQIL